MGIIYCEKDRTFTLHGTGNFISDAGGSVRISSLHLYYGKRQKAAWIIF